MNIAFPALFVFLLALPGIILRYSYREWGWKFPVYRLSIGEELAKSASFAVVLNVLWWVFAHCFGYRIIFGDVLILLTGGFGLKPGQLSKRLESITAHPYAVTTYFLTMYAAAALIGRIGHLAVRKFGLDLRFKALRFDNFWHYVLNAELPLFAENRKAYAAIANVPESELESKEVYVRVSCVVTHGSRSFIYAGTPVDYDFDRSGKLERIIVRDVSYQELYDPTPKEEAVPTESATEGAARTREAAQPLGEPLAIESDIFVLNCADIHNVGIEYFFPEEERIIENPFATGKFLNVTNFQPGTLVRDPSTGKTFTVPPR